MIVNLFITLVSEPGIKKKLKKIHERNREM